MGVRGLELGGSLMVKAANYEPIGLNPANPLLGSPYDFVRDRHMVVSLTNKSGVDLIEGDVVVTDLDNDDAVDVTSTIDLSSRTVGIAQEEIPNGSNGMILIGGYARRVNLNGSNVPRGWYLHTSNIKTAYGKAARGAGTFGEALTDDADPSAFIFLLPDVAGVGVTGLSFNGSNTLTGIVSLQAGSGIAIGVSGQEATITNTAQGGGGGGGTREKPEDVLLDNLPAPATRYDFDNTSLSGLTLLGTPDTENADTTVRDAYYVRQTATSSYVWEGRYLDPGPEPFTVITCIWDAVRRLSANAAGIFIGVSTPGNMDILSAHYTGSGRDILAVRATPTVFGSNFGLGANESRGADWPMYLAIRANSSTDYDYLFSLGGRIWQPFILARNPAITVDSAGLIIKSNNTGGFDMAAAFALFWVYTSALTFPGET